MYTISSFLYSYIVYIGQCIPDIFIALIHLLYLIIKTAQMLLLCISIWGFHACTRPHVTISHPSRSMYSWGTCLMAMDVHISAALYGGRRATPWHKNQEWNGFPRIISIQCIVLGSREPISLEAIIIDSITQSYNVIQSAGELAGGRKALNYLCYIIIL